MDYQGYEWQSDADRTSELDALVEVYIQRSAPGYRAAPQGTHPIHTLDIEIGFDSSVRDLTENAHRAT